MKAQFNTVLASFVAIVIATASASAQQAPTSDNALWTAHWA
jgi:hypothetical protein